MPKQTKTDLEKKGTEAAKATKEEGTVWVSSTTDYYKEPEITVEKLHDFKRNVYAAAAAQKLNNLVFQDTFELAIKDESGELDEELTQQVGQMLRQKDVALDAKMQMAFSDAIWYGPGLFNPVWGYEESEFRLLKLRHLPPRSFNMAPANALKIYSQLLRGIILNDKNEIEFWQTRTAANSLAEETVQLKNVLMVKNPASEELTGEPVMVPLIPVIEMLKFTWRAHMQRVNRIGAPLLFIRITEPMGPSELNGNIGDVAWAQKILQNWGKDTGYALRQNMELVDPHITDSSTAMEVLDALSTLLVSYFSPASFVASQGQLISSSDLPAQQMMIAYIKGIQQWLCDSFEPLVHTYLDANGYDGYTAELSLYPPEVDRSELLLKQAEVGIKGKALMPNEIRAKIGNEPLDDEDLQALEDYWSRQPASQPFVQEETAVPEDEERTASSAGIAKTMEAELQKAAREFGESLMKALANEDAQPAG